MVTSPKSRTSRASRSSPLRVRRATYGDLESVASLFDQYRQFYGQPPNLGLARAFLSERIKRRQSVILLVSRTTAGDEVAMGFVQLYPSFTSVSAGRLWILNDLFVAPHARRQGVAALLLEAARQHAQRTNAVRIELTTSHANSNARRLYERVGYCEDHEFVIYRRAP